MINILPAILFSLSANIDNIPLSMSYGMRKIHITFIQKLIIAIFTSIITIISMKCGTYLIYFLTSKIANFLGASILIAIGLIDTIKYFFLKKDNGQVIDNTLGKLNTKNLIKIIFTLSINNIGTGIAASITGINIIFTFTFTSIFSFLFIHIGNTIGKSIINSILLKYSDIIASLLILFLGIFQMF